MQGAAGAGQGAAAPLWALGLPLGKQLLPVACALSGGAACGAGEGAQAGREGKATDLKSFQVVSALSFSLNQCFLFSRSDLRAPGALGE